MEAKDKYALQGQNRKLKFANHNHCFCSTLFSSFKSETNLKGVGNSENILEYNSVFVDGENSKHPSDAKQWQQNQQVPHRRPENENTEKVLQRCLFSGALLSLLCELYICNISSISQCLCYLTLSRLLPVLAAFMPEPHIFARTTIRIMKLVCQNTQTLCIQKWPVDGKSNKNSEFQAACIESTHKNNEQSWSHKCPDDSILRGQPTTETLKEEYVQSTCTFLLHRKHTF